MSMSMHIVTLCLLLIVKTCVNVNAGEADIPETQPSGGSEVTTVSHMSSRFDDVGNKSWNDPCDEKSSQSNAYIGCHRPLQCINSRCDCDLGQGYVWSLREERCKMRAGEQPGLSPGCINDEDCIDGSRCVLFPCASVSKCIPNSHFVNTGMCQCNGDKDPKWGYQDGTCGSGSLGSKVILLVTASLSVLAVH